MEGMAKHEKHFCAKLSKEIGVKFSLLDDDETSSAVFFKTVRKRVNAVQKEETNQAF